MITFDSRGSIHFAAIIGRIDVISAPEIKADLTEYIKQNRSMTHLCADLSAVDFIDSTGMGVFITIHKTLLKNNQQFSLCCPQEQAKRLLKLSDLAKFFTVYPNRDEVA
ncbi:MAG: STAS domain-containing protein [Spirochaetes bacterium]|nr:STAS domain-containing protein [Spirochaetota bacterium]